MYTTRFQKAISMLQLGHIQLDIHEIRGEAIAILGIRGSGKTNTTAVIVEDVMSEIPFTIIDPQGEYYGLKERFDILIAGSGPQVEMPVAADQAAVLAEFVYTNNMSVILDLSGSTKKARDAFLVEYLRKLWSLAGTLRRLHFILIEEARQFIPQKGSSELGDLLTDYATMGRKLGLGMIIVNQRSSNISKDVLSQAGILILHQVAHAADLTIYKDLIPGMTNKEVETAVRSLKRGQAIFVRGATAEVITIRQRYTFHAGSTPDLLAPPLRTIDESLLADLRAALSLPSHDSGESRFEAAPPKTDTTALADLRRQLAEKEATIAKLLQQLAEFDTTIKALRAELAAKQTAPSVDEDTLPSDPIRTEAVVVVPAPAAARFHALESAPEFFLENQHKDLASLSEKIKTVPEQHRYFLAALLEQPFVWQRPEAIAQQFSYNQDLYKKMPPHPLLDLHVTDRGVEKGTGRQVYRLAESLRTRYPNFDLKTVISTLLAACRVNR